MRIARIGGTPTRRSSSTKRHEPSRGDLARSRIRTADADHSRTRRGLANARFAWSDGANRFSLSATALDQPDTLDPLGLTRAQLQREPRQAGSGALAFDTRKSTDYRQIGADWQRRIANGSTLRVRAYGGERAVRQFLAFSGVALGSSGAAVDLDNTFDRRYVASVIVRRYYESAPQRNYCAGVRAQATF